MEIQGFDTGRLDRLGAVGRRHVAAGRLPFASVQVARRGQVVYTDHHGWADIELGRPIEPDSIVRIFSMTKPVTSIALMQLYEAGEVLLEEPISSFVPEFADLEVWAGGTAAAPQTRPPTRPPSVKDVLTHQSGFTYGFAHQHPVDAMYREQGLGEFAMPAFSLADAVKRLAQLPLLFDPGTRWNYSMSTDVVGRIVEVISGQPLDEYLGEHILEPLGMVDTGFHVRAGAAHRLVDNHVAAVTLTQLNGVADSAVTSTGTGSHTSGYDPSHLVVIDKAATSGFLTRPAFLSGGGGLVSTLDDYQRFCDMLSNGGELAGERIIGQRTLAYMTRNHLTGGRSLDETGQSLFSDTDTRGMGFGLGFATVLDAAACGNVTNEGEYSWGGAASTVFWIDPVEQISVIFLTQLMPSTLYPIRRQLRAALYQALTD